MAQYRYSTPHLQRAILTAISMTAMVAGLVWMMMTAASRTDALLWASSAALVFFAFVSAGMLIRFLRKDVVLAVRPTGLYYARIGQQMISWDDIRDIVLRQRESEYELEIYLWKKSQSGTRAEADFVIELTQLDAFPGQIVEEFSHYKRVDTQN